MVIRIRQMRLDDIDEVMDIEPVAFGSHHWSHQSFVGELNNAMGSYFAAVDDQAKRLCGYSGFWLIGEEAHITTLAVHPDYRRQYIGERLLVHDIKEARHVGASWMTLEVRVSNESAQRLYFKYSFKSLGIRKNYYQDNDEDALVLWTENICKPAFKTLFNQRVLELEKNIKQLSENEESEEKVEATGTNGRNDPQRNKRNERKAHDSRVSTEVESRANVPD